MKKVLALLTALGISTDLHAQNVLQFYGIDDRAIALTSGPTGTMNRTVEA